MIARCRLGPHPATLLHGGTDTKLPLRDPTPDAEGDTWSCRIRTSGAKVATIRWTVGFGFTNVIVALFAARSRAHTPTVAIHTTSEQSITTHP